jgi:hypothetical protein
MNCGKGAVGRYVGKTAVALVVVVLGGAAVPQPAVESTGLQQSLVTATLGHVTALHNNNTVLTNPVPDPWR